MHIFCLAKLGYFFKFLRQTDVFVDCGIIDPDALPGLFCHRIFRRSLQGGTFENQSGHAKSLSGRIKKLRMNDFSLCRQDSCTGILLRTRSINVYALQYLCNVFPKIEVTDGS